MEHSRRSSYIRGFGTRPKKEHHKIVEKLLKNRDDENKNE
ncbi:hypothetical protein LBBP_01297 [Leptospira borgpetersenii serovar Ballum]|uniref:Uncharacterized protein n=1 Tax=Leptospira borgpetersenii serovar Ballum TaxID=280505 RepID=A0A0S2IPL3_LEPBO|nr:hypothetical protein LBBP_01297 [Leptospira borgpetersenii serovar Ballum]